MGQSEAKKSEAGMQAKFDITVLSGVSAGDVFHFDLTDSSSISVGRATECDLVLQDPMVSRKHLTVEKRSDGFFLVDQGSTHGTFHMGFHLKPGPEGARKLHDGDEFKVGEMLFRASFDENGFAPKAEKKVEDEPLKVKKTGILKSKAGMALLAVAGLALVYLLLPGGQKGKPPQKSNEVLSVPAYGVIGFFNSGAAGNRKEEQDFTHLDKAQFDIPASDVVIECDFVGKAHVNILLDDITIDRLQPSPAQWQTRQLIIRGIAEGRQRRLVFDNVDYPPPAGKAESAPARWAVRDVRASPLTRSFGVEGGFDAQLNSAIGLVEGIDKTPEGLFLLIRALQTSVVELLKEVKIDSASFVVDPGAEDSLNVTDISSLQQRLDVVRRGREQGVSSDASKYVSELTRIVSQLDAELWRRVNNRMTQARLASRVKNYIEAHDQLFSAKKMFPAEADYRWTMLNRMFNDKKIVPKRVRESPESYRK